MQTASCQIDWVTMPTDPESIRNAIRQAEDVGQDSQGFSVAARLLIAAEVAIDKLMDSVQRTQLRDLRKETTLKVYQHSDLYRPK